MQNIQPANVAYLDRQLQIVAPPETETYELNEVGVIELQSASDIREISVSMIINNPQIDYVKVDTFWQTHKVSGTGSTYEYHSTNINLMPSDQPRRIYVLTALGLEPEMIRVFDQMQID